MRQLANRGGFAAAIDTNYQEDCRLCLSELQVIALYPSLQHCHNALFQPRPAHICHCFRVLLQLAILPAVKDIPHAVTIDACNNQRC